MVKIEGFYKNKGKKTSAKVEKEKKRKEFGKKHSKKIEKGVKNEKNKRRVKKGI